MPKNYGILLEFAFRFSANLWLTERWTIDWTIGFIFFIGKAAWNWNNPNSEISFPINSSANDDAIRSINLITSVLANAIIEGKQGLEEVAPVVEEVAVEETVDAE